MIKKIILWMVSYVFGYLTIMFFPNLDLQNLSFFLAEFILNPLRFFLGMITFMITILVFSSFIRSAIEQTYQWIWRKKRLTISLILDYSIGISYFLLLQVSVWLTIIFLIFSSFYGIITADFEQENAHDFDD